MSVGFRKSLLGFNCSDVIDYIEKARKSRVESENKLNRKIDDINKDLLDSKAQIEGLLAEKAVLTAKLDEFNAKYDEIERLSENIGKLYLVSQANARAVMENSENNAALAEQEVSKNLASIEEAHIALAELRDEINKTSADFIGEVENLMSSLDTTRKQITENAEKIEEAKNEFDEVFSGMKA